MFPINIHIFPFRWRLYSGALHRSDNLGKTGYRCRLRFDVSLVNCVLWEPYIPGRDADDLV